MGTFDLYFKEPWLTSRTRQLDHPNHLKIVWHPSPGQITFEENYPSVLWVRIAISDFKGDVPFVITLHNSEPPSEEFYIPIVFREGSCDVFVYRASGTKNIHSQEKFARIKLYGMDGSLLIEQKVVIKSYKDSTKDADLVRYQKLSIHSSFYSIFTSLTINSAAPFRAEEPAQLITEYWNIVECLQNGKFDEGDALLENLSFRYQNSPDHLFYIILKKVEIKYVSSFTSLLSLSLDFFFLSYYRDSAEQMASDMRIWNNLASLRSFLSRVSC